MKHAAYALGLGLGTRNSNGDWLEVFFPNPVLSPSDELVAALGLSLIHI